MANNKITQLRSLTSGSLSAEDLFVVVDTSDTVSPTGDTKNINAENLASYVKTFVGDGGAVVQNFPWEAVYDDYLISNVVKIDAAGKLALADAKTAEDAEAVGIISDIVDTEYVEVTFSGKASFSSVIFTNSVGTPQGGSYFTSGDVYFLGEDGYLSEIDRSSLNPGWVSKPMFVASGQSSGVVVAYRGLVNTTPDSGSKPWEFLIYDDCSTFVVGDVLKKTKSGVTDWELASADSLADAEAVGVVKEIQFGEVDGVERKVLKLALHGYISGLKNLVVGETYYLTPRSGNPSTGTLGFDVNRETQRNVTPLSPVCPYFSRPIYIAISETEAVIVNQRTLPNPELESSDCSITDSAGRSRGSFRYIRDAAPGSLSESIATLFDQFLNIAVTDPVAGDRAEVYWISPTNPNQSGKWRMTYSGTSWSTLETLKAI